MPTLDFKGKHHIYAHHLSVAYRPLESEESRSCNPSGEEDNLIIHGDNLNALKALLPRYANRVKCIYIDPPYNTGNEGWIYSDNVNNPPMQEWFKEHSPVDNEDLEKHDKWLCMMWPRLHLLKELLSEDGVIFISIDDNEVHHLRMLMDEIFGNENFLNCFAWINNLKGRQIAKSGAARTHEYILAYAKSSEDSTTWHPISVEKATQLMPDAYKMGEYKILHDKIGPYVIKNELHNTNSKFNESTRPNLVFNIHYCPEINEVLFTDVDSTLQYEGFVRIPPKVCNDGIHRFQAWRWGKDKIRDELHNLHFEKCDNSFRIYTKIRNFEFTNFKDLITNISSSNAVLKSIGIEFPNPKPIDLIKLLIRATSSENAIILDSFAGSGTTAHAVLALNKEDGGNRKFILVECEDFADTVTAKRVRRVINGVENAKNKTLKEGLGGSFTYCTLGEPIEIEAMLTGETLPAYPVLAAHLLFTAAGISAGDEKLEQKNDDGLFYSDDKNDYYLHYQPDLDYLSSDEAILTQAHAERIQDAGRQNGKKAIVYAAGNYIGQRELTKMGIVFCQLPYVLHER